MPVNVCCTPVEAPIPIAVSEMGSQPCNTTIAKSSDRRQEMRLTNLSVRPTCCCRDMTHRFCYVSFRLRCRIIFAQEQGHMLGKYHIGSTFLLVLPNCSQGELRVKRQLLGLTSRFGRSVNVSVVSCVTGVKFELISLTTIKERK